MLWLGFVVALSLPARGADVDTAQEPATIPALTAAELDPAAWLLGGTAPREVIAPLAFASVDPTETVRLKAQAAAEVTPVFRFVPATADAAVAEFDALVTAGRENFLSAATAAFGPTPFDAKTFLGDAFESFRRRWADEHPGSFVPSPALARTWALELDDASWLRPWREALREVLSEQRICAGDVADPSVEPTSDCRLVTTEAPDEPLDAAFVAQHASLIDRRQLWTLDQARASFRQRIAAAEPAADVVCGLVRPNTFPEPLLTEQERVERARNVSAPPREYPAGTLLLRAGDVIGPREHAALADLRTSLAALPPRFDDRAIAPTPVAATAAPAPLPIEAAPPVESNPIFSARGILIGGILLVGLPAVVIGWRRSRNSRRTALMVTGPKNDEPQSPVVVALRDATVQHLYSHRQVLLAEQDRSTEQVSVLEARVARLHPQIQARIRTYEGRIKELEAMLSEKRHAHSNESGPSLRSPRSDHADPKVRAAIGGSNQS